MKKKKKNKAKKANPYYWVSTAYLNYLPLISFILKQSFKNLGEILFFNIVLRDQNSNVQGVCEETKCNDKSN